MAPKGRRVHKEIKEIRVQRAPKGRRVHKEIRV